MNQTLRSDAETIARAAIDAVKPDAAVKAALAHFAPAGRLYLFAVGKAAWQMARAALELPGIRPEAGIVLTKYGHVGHPLEHVLCLEAGHPVPDGNSYQGTQAILDMSEHLRETDTVLFLLSGGGSALFEQPRIAPERMEQLTRLLLASGADITEINTIRKRLSMVKGGQFAAWCAPAKVYTVVLSDILGGPLDMIAGGPTVPDTSTAQQAIAIAEKYRLPLTAEERPLLRTELPRALPNAEAHIIGSVRQLCGAAMSGCAALGYTPLLLTDRLACEAREAGRFLGAIARSHAADGKKLAFLAGGETVVHLRGSGLGGRNQELALAAAEELAGIPNAAILSVGSDGTDGPTDAAGGYADGDTWGELERLGIDVEAYLNNNDAYHALQAVQNLIITGPTGTNVNDLSLVLIDGDAGACAAT
ncbi:MAG: DUF4147 domain-containing protein [Clostridiales bacterium]|nr:DUF4147 domain-containing protein [Clostridiales bacterium]